MKEYVRKGAKTGSVELVISGGPDAADHRIERILDSNKSASTFKINGARTCRACTPHQHFHLP